MRVSAALAPLALAATMAVPAPPASAYVGCGGVWTAAAWCTFYIPMVAENPLPYTQVKLSGRAFASSKANVRVALHDMVRGVWVEVAHCSGTGLAVANCTTTTLVYGGTYACSVSGNASGKYICAVSYA